MKRIIGKFEPINNTIGYDIREIVYSEGKIQVRNLKVERFSGEVDKLLIFKPSNMFKCWKDFHNQFSEYLGLPTQKSLL